MNTLLQRSDEFRDALVATFGRDVVLFDDSPKLLACAGACQLSIEHSMVVRLAFASNASFSATALLRLQYEALLRGAWLLHAASDADVVRLTTTIDLGSEQRAKNVAGPADMLKALVAKAPPSLVKPLQQFDDVSRKTLNSYVHTGLHPLQRVAVGFPKPLANQIVRNSNGLMHIAYRLLATLSGNQAQVDATTRVYLLYPDCLPVV